MRDHRPPRLLIRWLEARLPLEVREAISGDLQAAYADRRARGDGRLRSNLWLLGQLLVIRSGALRRSARRLATSRPTTDRNRPNAATADHTLLETVFPVHINDLKYALRRLGRSPGFTLVAVASLALGIGANTAMFSIVNAVLFRGLPVADADEIVEVYTSEEDGFAWSVSSHADYLDMRTRTEAFQSVIGSRTTIARMDVNGEPEVAFGELVSWDWFQTLGVPMHRGRPFVEEEDQAPGAHPVVILGYRMWQGSFGADPDILGQTVQVNGRAYTVVGVAPRSYTGSLPVMVSGFYAPLMMTDEVMGSPQLDRRGSRSMFLKARLRPGVSVERANEELGALATALAAEYPESNRNRTMTALPSGDVSIHPAADRILGPVAALLLAAVGLVLLIACTNLASFLLARAEDRRREIAVRLALGAARRRLIGQLLIETTMLALLGGVAGVALAHWTIGLLTALQPPLPIPIDFEISIDRTVLAFTALVSIVAGLLFGLLPAVQATNPDVAPTLKDEVAGAGSRNRWNLRNGLVVTQLAFSFVLLIGAGLFLRSLEKAQRIDPGFDMGPGAIVWPMPELAGYETPEEVAAFYRQYEDRLLRDPLVTGVALADRLPLGMAVQTAGYIIPGVPSESPDGDHDIDNAQVNPGYFDAMGVEIVAGRAFTDDDIAGEPVVVVSEAFQERFFPGQSAVGRSIEDSGATLRILGVAGDTKVRTLGEEARPYVYQLHGQMGFFGMQVVVKGTGSSAELVAAARAALDEVAPDMVLFEATKTMDEHLALLLFPPRIAALLLTVFGALALLLAGIGVFGVVSYSVARRTREVGIRMSLGASAGEVTRMSVAGAMRLVLIGAVAGTVLAGAVTWSVSSYLFGISGTDVVTFVAIPLLLITVALVAAWIPARRAARIDPVGALRAD